MNAHESHVLIVEDDASMRELLAAILKEYTLYQAATLSEARDIIAHNDIHITLLDIRLPDGSGIELLKSIKENDAKHEVIIISSVRDIPTVVKAMKMGAYDYIHKDFEYDDIRILVERAVQAVSQQRELLYLKSEISQYTAVDYVVGKGPKMRQVEELVQKTAQVPAAVLLTGESGAGKCLIARRIHSLSALSNKPFVSMNLSTIPEDAMEVALFGRDDGKGHIQYGKIEMAAGGTLFLDEIGELRGDIQLKLLRAIHENTIERVGSAKPIHARVRVISATQLDLEALLKEGRFREDLYYRLNVIHIHLPPLRERIEDLPPLLSLFIKKYAKQFNRPVRNVNDTAMAILKTYNWPGNIRELESLVEKVVAVSERNEITERDIPIEYQVYQLDELKKSGEEDLIKAATDAFERSFILNVLEKENWNQTRASERLGIHRKTLEYKIKKLKLGDIIDAKR